MIYPGFIAGGRKLIDIDELYAEFAWADGGTIADEVFSEFAWADGGTIADEIFAEFAKEE